MIFFMMFLTRLRGRGTKCPFPRDDATPVFQSDRLRRPASLRSVWKETWRIPKHWNKVPQNFPGLGKRRRDIMLRA
jgi:hypothetical protein